jgi:hypothetical protein
MKSEHLIDVFNFQEIQLIDKILGNIPGQMHSGKLKSIYTNGFRESDFVFSAIKRAVIDPINRRTSYPITRVQLGMKLDTRNPFPIHTDSAGKGDNGKGYAYLIPLSQKGNSDKSSYTITFHQTWEPTQEPEDYIKTNPRLPSHNCDDIWDEHLDHNPRHWAKYFSVQTLAPWIPGSVIVWDRSLFHCSDNFLKKGIFGKTALVLFTSTS